MVQTYWPFPLGLGDLFEKYWPSPRAKKCALETLTLRPNIRASVTHTLRVLCPTDSESYATGHHLVGSKKLRYDRLKWPQFSFRNSTLRMKKMNTYSPKINLNFAVCDVRHFLFVFVRCQMVGINVISRGRVESPRKFWHIKKWCGYWDTPPNCRNRQMLVKFCHF